MTDPNSADDNVIPFRGTYRAPEAKSVEDRPSFTVTRGYVKGPCHGGWHIAVVDANARRVQCQRCEADLDPFVVLGDIARHHDWYTHLIAEKERLSREVETLGDEVKKLRAARNRTKRATTDE